MNAFNRAVIVLIILGALIATGSVLLVSLDLVSPKSLLPSPWYLVFQPLEQLDTLSWGWTVGVCLFVIPFGSLLLLLELRPTGREEKRLTLKKDGLGHVTVACRGVEELVSREAGGVAGVMEVRSRVKHSRAGLRIFGRVAVDPAVNVPELAQELQKRVKAAVEHHLSRQVVEVRIDTQLAPLEGKSRWRRRVR